MWRTLLITVLWSANIFCYNLKFTERNGKIGPNPDLVFTESLSPNSGEEILEVKSIHYTSAPKTRIAVEYQNEDLPGNRNVREDSVEDSSEGGDGTFQPWSILWYIGSFGGLIAFFLVVSCSEWCCRSHGTSRNARNSVPSSPSPSEAPPPAYDLFAPPSYESLCHDGEKREYDVYVVPVHAMDSTRGVQIDDAHAPPAYFVNSANRTSDVPEEVVINVLRSEEEYRDRHKEQSETDT